MIRQAECRSIIFDREVCKGEQWTATSSLDNRPRHPRLWIHHGRMKRTMDTLCFRMRPMLRRTNMRRLWSSTGGVRIVRIVRISFENATVFSSDSSDYRGIRGSPSEPSVAGNGKAKQDPQIHWGLLWGKSFSGFWNWNLELTPCNKIQQTSSQLKMPVLAILGPQLPFVISLGTEKPPENTNLWVEPLLTPQATPKAGGLFWTACLFCPERLKEMQPHACLCNIFFVEGSIDN